MNRIMIIGSPGSGKTTLAKKLHRKTGLPMIHLDQEYWGPKWEKSSKEVWTKKVSEFVAGESWIIDGNYGGTMHLRFPRADTVILMDFNPWLCTWRALCRSIRYLGRSRADMAPGCNEKIDFHFLLYVARFRKTRGRKLVEQVKGMAEEKQVYILRSDQEVREYLNSQSGS